MTRCIHAIHPTIRSLILILTLTSACSPSVLAEAAVEPNTDVPLGDILHRQREHEVI